jgi:hypothetical protein
MGKHWRASRAIDLLFRVGAWPKKRLVKISGDEWLVEMSEDEVFVKIFLRNFVFGGHDV